mmetsp:Transcript_80802/g.250819  ORF Transcript_80802/g.250819 Transcript_80802/m.250819 type:complete len:209 (+) Transcript_80802:1114-1740(+)
MSSTFCGPHATCRSSGASSPIATTATYTSTASSGRSCWCRGREPWTTSWSGSRPAPCRPATSSRRCRRSGGPSAPRRWRPCGGYSGWATAMLAVGSRRARRRPSPASPAAGRWTWRWRATRPRPSAAPATPTCPRGLSSADGRGRLLPHSRRPPWRTSRRARARLTAAQPGPRRGSLYSAAPAGNCCLRSTPSRAGRPATSSRRARRP